MATDIWQKRIKLERGNIMCSHSGHFDCDKRYRRDKII